MDEYVLNDDLLVECENCHADMPAKVSILETDNSVVCQECGTRRTVNIEELHRQLANMRETLEEMRRAGENASGTAD